MHTYKVVFFIIAHGFLCAYGMEGELPKRKREEKEVKESHAKKLKRELSAKKQAKVNAHLLNAVMEDDEKEALENAKNALNQGAQINYHDSEDESVLSLALEHGKAKMVRYLLEQGAQVADQEIEQAVMYGTTDDLLTLLQYGGILSLSTQAEIFNIISLFALTPDYHEMNSSNNPRLSDTALWAFLRLYPSYEEENEDREAKEKQDLHKNPFETSNLAARLGTLLKSFITGYDGEAENCINQLMNSYKLSEEDKRAINEALIFSAAHDNEEILKLILDNFEDAIKQEAVAQALEAAALHGKDRAFNCLVESEYLKEQELCHALENALMIAASQMHKTLFSFILALDEEQGLNLNLLPIGQRLDLLAHEELPLERRKFYTHLRNQLAHYIRRRNARRIDRILFSQPYYREDEDEEREQNTLPLPPELTRSIFTLTKGLHY